MFRLLVVALAMVSGQAWAGECLKPTDPLTGLLWRVEWRVSQRSFERYVLYLGKPTCVAVDDHVGGFEEKSVNVVQLLFHDESEPKDRDFYMTEGLTVSDKLAQTQTFYD